MPPAVLRRITEGQADLLRLLRCATDGGAAAPAGRLEAAFCKQLDLQGMAQTELVAPGSRVRPAVPSAWMASIWDALALHCYFTPSVPGTVNTTEIGHKDNGAARVAVAAFDWAAAVCLMASRLPYEGLSEREVGSLLKAHYRSLEARPPLWLPHFSRADSFAQFLHRRFPHVLLVTRSAVTREALIHCVGRNSVSPTWLPDQGERRGAASSSATPRHLSPACVGLQYALQIVGRGHQLPVWTDAEAVAPLLPISSGLSTARPSEWREAWLRNSDLRGTFHLDGYVRVRALPTAARLLVIVDATTVDEVMMPVLLGACAEVTRLRSEGSANMTVKLLCRATSAGAAMGPLRGTLASSLGASALIDDVVVDQLLEPQHMLGALLDAEVNATAAVKTEDPPNATSRREETGKDAPAKPFDDSFAASSSSSATVLARSPLQVLVMCGDDVRAAFAETLAEAKVEGLDVTLVTPASVRGGQ